MLVRSMGIALVASTLVGCVFIISQLRRERVLYEDFEQVNPKISREDELNSASVELVLGERGKREEGGQKKINVDRINRRIIGEKEKQEDQEESSTIAIEGKEDNYLSNSPGSDGFDGDRPISDKGETYQKRSKNHYQNHEGSNDTANVRKRWVDDRSYIIVEQIGPFRLKESSLSAVRPKANISLFKGLLDSAPGITSCGGRYPSPWMHEAIPCCSWQNKSSRPSFLWPKHARTQWPVPVLLDAFASRWQDAIIFQLTPMAGPEEHLVRDRTPICVRMNYTAYAFQVEIYGSMDNSDSSSHGNTVSADDTNSRSPIEGEGKKSPSFPSLIQRTRCEPVKLHNEFDEQYDDQTAPPKDYDNYRMCQFNVFVICRLENSTRKILTTREPIVASLIRAKKERYFPILICPHRLYPVYSSPSSVSSDHHEEEIGIREYDDENRKISNVEGEETKKRKKNTGYHYKHYSSNIDDGENESIAADSGKSKKLETVEYHDDKFNNIILSTMRGGENHRYQQRKQHKQLAMCTVVNPQYDSETERIISWIAYHLLVGVEQVFVYMIPRTNNLRRSQESNGSFLFVDEYEAIWTGLSRVVDLEAVSLIPWPYHPRGFEIEISHLSAYDNCMWRAKEHYHWVLNAQADEFFQPLGSFRDLRDVLTQKKYSDARTLSFLEYSWFNASLMEKNFENDDGCTHCKITPFQVLDHSEYPSGVTMPHHGYGAINDENVHKRGVYYNASGCIISHMGDNYIRTASLAKWVNHAFYAGVHVPDIGFQNEAPNDLSSFPLEHQYVLDPFTEARQNHFTGHAHNDFLVRAEMHHVPHRITKDDVSIAVLHQCIQILLGWNERNITEIGSRIKHAWECKNANWIEIAFSGCGPLTPDFPPAENVGS